MNNLKNNEDDMILVSLTLRRVQVLLVKNEKEHAWAINSRNID